MIRRANERVHTATEHMKGGKGTVRAAQILNTPEEFYGKGRLFNHITLEKECEVGWHVHSGDGEFYYILTGEGEYNDNGTLTTVKPGDVCICNDGEGHSLLNHGDEPLTFISLILFS